MSSTIQNISLIDLSIAFIPVFIGLYFLYLWSLNIKQAGYALMRMLVHDHLITPMDDALELCLGL